MALFKIQIKIKSPLATPLKGDTIWGHVAWGIANHKGDDAVQDFIADCKQNAAFVISSAFPKGMVCKKIPEVPERLENLSEEEYAKIKQAKKIKYESAYLYFAGGAGSSSDGAGKKGGSVSGGAGSESDGNDESAVNPFKQNVVTHNTISRLTNTVLESGLYSASELWADEKNACFDLYIRSLYDAKKVTELCAWAFENGFGADSSVGKGQIEIAGEALEIVPKMSGNKYMALSPFVVPDLSQIKKLRADIFVRSGKIGGAFVSSLAPWKKTVVLYDEGAVFESDKKIEWIGQLLENVHSDPRIVQSTFAPVIPIE